MRCARACEVRASAFTNTRHDQSFFSKDQMSWALYNEVHFLLLVLKAPFSSGIEWWDLNATNKGFKKKKERNGVRKTYNSRYSLSERDARFSSVYDRMWQILLLFQYICCKSLAARWSTRARAEGSLGTSADFMEIS